MQVLAPAKINLFLKILSRRKDGYHNILSVLQTVSLYDKIKLTKLNQDKIIIDSNLKSISGEKNLCYKVAELIKKKYKIKQGIKIVITKNIPLGSGLGGASSDAAAVVESMLKMFNIKTSKDKIVKLCSSIGKDIPFFLYKGTCLVRSTGEIVEKIKDVPWSKKPLWIIIVYPNKILSTKEVYDTYDKIKNKLNKNTFSEPTIVKFLKQNRLNELVYNELEPAACVLYPKLKKIKNLLLKMTNYKFPVSLTGAGSCYYCIFHKKNDMIKFKNKIRKKLSNCKIFVVHTIN